MQRRRVLVAGVAAPVLLGGCDVKPVAVFADIPAALRTLEAMPPTAHMAEGWTLALDFPNRGAATETLFRRLDELTFAAGGRLYAAKDARMTPEAFASSAPRLAEFRRYVDPACRSDLAQRLRIIP